MCLSWDEDFVINSKLRRMGTRWIQNKALIFVLFELLVSKDKISKPFSKEFFSPKSICSC